MSTPHPQSVISVEIKALNEDLYNKLITMENVNYTTPNVGTISDHQDIWRVYNQAWLDYIQDIRLSSNQATSSVMALYSFVMLHFSQGVGGVEFFEECKPENIFNSGGLIDSVLSYPDNYYNDLIIPPPPIMPGAEELEPYSPRMDTDVPKLPVAATGDKRRYDALMQDKIPALIQGYQMTVLFGDPLPPIQMLSKAEIWDMIFITLGWKALFETMGVDSTIPPRP